MRDASFTGDRLDDPGTVAVLFGGIGCGHTTRFLRHFESWTADGVEKAVAWVDLRGGPLWDELDLKATPTLALFRDGRLAWRRDPTLHEDLDPEALEECAASASEAPRA